MVIDVLHCPNCQGTDMVRHGTTRCWHCLGPGAQSERLAALKVLLVIYPGFSQVRARRGLQGPSCKRQDGAGTARKLRVLWYFPECKIAV